MMRAATFVCLTMLSVGIVVQAAQKEHRERRPRRGGAPAADVEAETATHREGTPVDVHFTRLSSICLAPNGNLLACDAAEKVIKVIAPDMSVTNTIALDFAPFAIDVAADGTIYCGGDGALAKFSASGELITSVAPPKGIASTPAGRRKSNRPTRVSGLAVSEGDVFIAFGSGGSTGSRSKLFRMDRDFENPKMLREGLRGCCQRLDLAFRDGVLYVAENLAKRVLKLDRNGTALAKWGEGSRDAIEGFGSCCNPMNLFIAPDGTITSVHSGALSAADLRSRINAELL